MNKANCVNSSWLNENDIIVMLINAFVSFQLITEVIIALSLFASLLLWS